MGDRPFLLHDLAQVVDFEFVNVGCNRCFAEETGWPPYEPALILKTVVLHPLSNLSDRQAEEAVMCTLLYKWLLDLAGAEWPPGHTALRRFWTQWGPAWFPALFNLVVAEAHFRPPRTLEVCFCNSHRLSRYPTGPIYLARGPTPSGSDTLHRVCIER
jgi:hypothetical protein